MSMSNSSCMKYRQGGYTIYDCESGGGESYMIDNVWSLCRDNGVKDNDCKIVNVHELKKEICCCVDDL